MYGRESRVSKSFQIYIYPRGGGGFGNPYLKSSRVLKIWETRRLSTTALSKTQRDTKSVLAKIIFELRAGGLAEPHLRERGDVVQIGAVEDFARRLAGLPLNTQYLDLGVS